MHPIPRSAEVLIVGGGIAGAATAWALACARVPGVLIEREAAFGSHASGRNAGMLRQLEYDGVLRRAAHASVMAMRALDGTGSGALLRSTGGVLLASGDEAQRLSSAVGPIRADGIDAIELAPRDARARFPHLEGLRFDVAVYSPDDAVVDVNALLQFYLRAARGAGWALVPDCRAEALLVDGQQVKGVRTAHGEIRAGSVIDATGAWAGELLPAGHALPLHPLRRHLMMSGPTSLIPRDAPFTWDIDAGYYFRPEGDGLLLSPCDESAHPPSEPSLDPSTLDLLAQKIARCAPPLAGLTMRRSWACLRTFAPDRRPLIGSDPTLSGLFHVSGLGGFGVTASAFVGPMAARLLLGQGADSEETRAMSPSRFKAVKP